MRGKKYLAKDSLLLVIALLTELVKNDVSDDTEDKSASDSGQGNLAKGNAESADTGDKDCGNGEEVSSIVKVNLLNHLKTGNCNKSVKCDTNAAQYTVGNGRKEGNKGTEEGDYDAHDCSGRNGANGSILGDSYATN